MGQPIYLGYFPLPTGGVESRYELPDVEAWEAASAGPDPFKQRVPPEEFVTAIPSVFTRMGAKSQLKAWLVEQFPPCHTYVEPFFATGQILLAKPRRDRVEIVNDYDPDLVEFWRWAVHSPQLLVDTIRSVPIHEAIIYGLREQLARKELHGVERAAAWYLGSQSAFNAKGNYSSYASAPHRLMDLDINEDRLKAVVRRLAGVDIRSCSFERIMRSCNKDLPADRYPPGGVFFYLDPPYWATEDYKLMDGSGGFTWEMQVGLSEWCEKIDLMGNKFIETNSYHPDLVALYSGYKKSDGSPRFFLKKKAVKYTMSGYAQSEFFELIVSNFPLGSDAIKKKDYRQSSLFGG